MKHIINFKTDDKTPFDKLKRFVNHETILVVPGGTTSQDQDKSKLSKIEIKGIWNMGCQLIYSMNLNGTIFNETNQVQTLSRGAKIYAIRYGNEDYTDRDFTKFNNQTKDTEFWKMGMDNAYKYISKAMPFIKAFERFDALGILVGAMPSNQLNGMFNAYRHGWNEVVISYARKLGFMVDFHAYHRNREPEFETTLFKSTLDEMKGVRAVICEASALPFNPKTGQGHKADTFTFAAQQTFYQTTKSLRPDDITGAHLFHHPLQNIGLIDTTGDVITEFGTVFFEVVGNKQKVVQIELFTGEQLRDQGIERAEKGANRTDPEWSEKAFNYLTQYITKDEPFTTEDLRTAAMEENKVPDNVNPKAWGAIITKAVKAGIIVRVGYGRAKNPKSHKGINSIWRKA